MDIRDIRAKTGLSESQFRQKLQPCLKKNHSLLTKQMLEKLEKGEELNEHRMNAVVVSIQETFPELSEVKIKPKTRKKILSVSPFYAAIISVGIIFSLAFSLYFGFGKKDIIIEILTLCTLLAPLLGVIWYYRPNK